MFIPIYSLLTPCSMAKLLGSISKLKMLYVNKDFVMPGLTRHPVNNFFNWIPAFQTV